jgi:DNA modification methylase
MVVDTTTLPHRQHLARDFVLPPFSVLDSRSGRWQHRKRQWREIGIGRGQNDSDPSTRGNLTFDERGWSKEVFAVRALRRLTSEFDPVLAEVLTHWFVPPKGTILDPFSGGIVRGAVAALTGRMYLGIDLREEQVTNNYGEWDSVEAVEPDGGGAEWLPGDARSVLTTLDDPVDAVFTCPPYGDLERYSDDPRDLSNMEHRDFLRAYSEILVKSYRLLRDERFFVIVVGDFRDEDGFYRRFPDATRAICTEIGLRLYNSIVLLNRAGSAAVRARPQFTAARKTVLTHQEVLVFYKGNKPPAWHGEKPMGPPIAPPSKDDLIFDLFGG